MKKAFYFSLLLMLLGANLVVMTGCDRSKAVELPKDSKAPSQPADALKAKSMLVSAPAVQQPANNSPSAAKSPEPVQASPKGLEMQLFHSALKQMNDEIKRHDRQLNEAEREKADEASQKEERQRDQLYPQAQKEKTR